MANKSIKELPKASQIQEDDALPMQQGSTTKQVTGLTLTLWLLGMADGHGGVTDFQKLSESGLEKTYQFTMADTTKYTFTVTDGNGVADFKHSVIGLVHTYKLIMDNGQEYTFTVTDGNGVADFKHSVIGLVHTYKLILDDGQEYTMTIKDGEKGDKGDAAHLWYKFASEKPTSSSSSMGDEPDAWMGLHSGHEATAPTDPMEYTWVRVLGNTGPTGAPATVVTNKTEYQVSDSGTIVPSGNWSTAVPPVTPGKYLWARTTTQFNTGAANYAYSVSRFGIDGSGSVVTVNDVSPDENGNVTLTAADVGALDVNGSTMKGPLHMNGQVLDGLNDPKQDDEAVRKAYVDKSMRAAAPVNLLDNSDFRHPVAQAGIGGNHGTQAYAVDRWILSSGSVSQQDGGLQLNGTITQKLEYPPAGNVSAFVGMASGQASISYSCGAVTITSAGGIVAWAALYEGEYTDETKPEYQPKGYSAELDECQKHYLPLEQISSSATKNDDTHLRMPITLPKIMRKAPSIVDSQMGWAMWSNNGYFQNDGSVTATLFSGTPASVTLLLDIGTSGIASMGDVRPVFTFMNRLVLSAEEL